MPDIRLLAFTGVFAVLLLNVAAAASPVDADDVIVTVQDGKIVTGGVVGGELIFPWQVFESELGEDFENFSDEPGFDSEAGAMPPGAVASIAIRKALRVWNQRDAHFHDIAAPEQMEVQMPGGTIITPFFDPPPGDPLPSLNLGTISGGGVIHVHPWYHLTAPHGDGAYLLELEFRLSTPGIEPSDPFWVVFGQSVPHEVVDDAVAWVEENLAGVDDPACPGDLTGDGAVGVDDLLVLLAAWGPNPGHAADLTGDGAVGVDDLLILLAAWGPCA